MYHIRILWNFYKVNNLKESSIWRSLFGCVLSLFTYFERERERERKHKLCGTERKGERENPKQNPNPIHSQHGAQTHEPCDDGLSQNRTLN